MYKREKVLEEVKKYFNIWELVSEKVYRKYGERAWRFMDTDLLACLFVIREGLGRPITINNWKRGGEFSQRGLRENTSRIVSNKTNANKLYLSAHTMGKAVDFDVRGLTAEEARKEIVKLGEALPCKVRLEHYKGDTPISWVHLDVFWEERNKKVYLFDV